MENFPGPFERWKTRNRYKFLSKNYRKLLDDYYTYSLGQQLVPGTIKRKWDIVLRFLEFLELIHIGEINRVNIEIINTFIASVRRDINRNETHNSIKYAYSFSATLKTFFNFLHEAGIILINPAPKIKLPKLEKSLPKAILTKEEALQLLDSQNTASFIGLRNKVILELLYGCGLRGREVRLLKLDDVDLKSGLLMVKEGKMKKDRFVPIGKTTSCWLERYLAARRMIAAESPYIFLTDHESVPIGWQILWHIVKVAAKKAKIAKRVVPYTLRHSYATHLLEAGAPLNAIQALLGHAHLETTQIYTHVAIPKLKSLHSQFHPRERFQVAIEGGKIKWKTK